MYVSVITPVYNSENTLLRCIQSVQEQEHCCEQIFVDALSSDNSLNIIRTSMRQNDKLISEPDKGIYDAINKGIKSAKGSVIAILNSDDYFLNQSTLLSVVATLKSGTQMAYAGTRYFTDQKGNFVDYLPSEFGGIGSFQSGWHPPHPSFFVLRQCYEIGGLYDVNLRVAADFDLMLRFFETYCFSSKKIPEVLVGMSSGGYSSKPLSIARGMSEIKHSFKKNAQMAPFGYFAKRYMKKFIERKLGL